MRTKNDLWRGKPDRHVSALVLIVFSSIPTFDSPLPHSLFFPASRKNPAVLYLFCFSSISKMKLDPSLFHISTKTGFVLESPLDTLPEYFHPWQDAARNILRTIHDPGFRDHLLQLPLLDADRLEGHRQIRLAHLHMVTLVSGYVWCRGDEDVPRMLPKNLAVPFFKLNEKLGLTPGIGPHVAVALCNYRRTDENEKLSSENMEMLSFKFIEDYGNDWFFLATIQVELEFAAAVVPIRNAIAAASIKDTASLREHLHEIRRVIENMDAALSRMSEKLKPDVFFNLFRFYLAGTTEGKFAEWGGIILEGVSDRPFKLTGGSAAQAAPIQCLDALLQIEHEPKSRHFLTEMRRYMLPEHRRFIEAIETSSRVRRVVAENAGVEEELKRAFDQCVRALVDFRNRHIQIVTKYILVPKAKNQRSNMERSAKTYKTLDEVGTGGTGIMPFLKSVRDTTKECVTE